jgi:hypothetical protein
MVGENKAISLFENSCCHAAVAFKETAHLLRLKFRTILMLKCKEPDAMAPRTAADGSVVCSAIGWSEPVPGRELRPLKSSAIHGALLRQQSETVS